MGRANATGRSKRADRYFTVEHFAMNTVSWRALRPLSRALYFEIKKLYNGYNNGQLFLSVRNAGKLLGVHKDTASKAFRDLEAKGYIRAKTRSSFDYKMRKATCWILTEYKLGDELPTKDFAKWRSEKNPRS